MGLKQFAASLKAGAAKKAVVAGVTGFVGGITTALADGDLTLTEVIVAVLTGVVAVLGVYQTTNEPDVPVE